MSVVEVPSRREADVLELVGQHLTNAEIAQRLFISVRTVESHVSALLRKLGAEDRRALAAYASAKTGLVGSVGPPVALPARLSTAPPVGFVGRDTEQRRLADAVNAAIVGEGRRLVVLCGESGVGKTTLVAFASRAAHAQSVTVLYGRCDQDLAVPYGPFVEVVSYYLAHAPAGWLASHDPHRLGELGRLVPGLASRFRELPPPTVTDPDAERYLLFGAVADLLDEAARKAPLMVVLDDLHCADQSTVRLLCYLTARPLSRVVMVGSYRHTDLPASHPLTDALAVLHGKQEIEHITIEGLNPADVAAMVVAAVGHDLGQAGRDLADALYRETDGNPFFVVEILRHLAETGTLVRGSDGRWTLNTNLSAAGLPHSVRKVVGARVGRLGDRAVAVLSTASVMGQEFDLDLLCRAARLDEDEILDILGRAERLALVSETSEMPEQFRFAHALIRRTLYEDLGRTRQSRAHARVAEAIEEQCGADPGRRTGEIALHLLAGVTRPTQIAKAVAYAQLAGERALLALAPDDAVGWYSQALTALGRAPDEVARAGCLIGLGDAQRQAGDPHFRGTLLDAARLARQLGDQENLVRAALANNRGFESSSGEVDAERVSILEAAIDVTNEDTPQRARLLATLAVELTYHPDLRRRLSLADEAVAVARRTHDESALFDALVRPYPALIVPELADHRLNRLHDAVRLSDTIDDPVARFWMLIWLSHSMVERAEIERADQACSEVDQIASRLDQPSLRWASTWASSWRALLAGDTPQAERLAAEALQLGIDSGQPDALLIYGLQLFCVRWHQGRIDELLPSVRQLAEDHRDDLPAWQAALAFAEALEGDPSRARQLVDAGAATGFELPADRVGLIGTCAWAEAAAEVGDEAAAAVLYQRLAPWHDHVPISGHAVFHCVAHSLGRLAAILGHAEQAEAHLTEALMIHERLRAPFFVAETKLALAQLLEGVNPDLSRSLLVDAAAVATRHSYGRLERLTYQAL
jgi:DNA-binding CsgD family transcriptional regulator